MSRRIQIIRRTFNENVSDSPHAPTVPISDTVIRIFGRGGVATSPDTDCEQLLLHIAQLLTASRVDQHGWSLNGVCTTLHHNYQLGQTLNDDTPYRPLRKTKPVEEIVLDAKEVILRGQVVWRCAKNGSIVFPSFHDHYNDLTAGELLITCAVHLLPAHMRERLTTPAWERQALGRVNRQQPPPTVSFIAPDAARWAYKHEGD